MRLMTMTGRYIGTPNGIILCVSKRCRVLFGKLNDAFSVTLNVAILC